MTIQEVKKIAQLARIQLTDEEIERLAHQLSDILAYVEQLNELDTTEVPITSQVSLLTNVMREDVVEQSEITGELIAQAPDVEDGGIKVKKVF